MTHSFLRFALFANAPNPDENFSPNSNKISRLCPSLHLHPIFKSRTPPFLFIQPHSCSHWTRKGGAGLAGKLGCGRGCKPPVRCPGSLAGLPPSRCPGPLGWVPPSRCPGPLDARSPSRLTAASTIKSFFKFNCNFKSSSPTSSSVACCEPMRSEG